MEKNKHIPLLKARQRGYTPTPEAYFKRVLKARLTKEIVENLYSNIDPDKSYLHKEYKGLIQDKDK